MLSIEILMLELQPVVLEKFSSEYFDKLKNTIFYDLL